MKLPYKNQNGEVILEENIKNAFTEEDIQVFFSFNNELDVTNKYVKVVSNVKKPKNIYTFGKGIKIDNLMACGVSKKTAEDLLNKKYINKKNTVWVTWKKISHLLEPVALEKHVALEDGRIVKYKDYESVLQENINYFIMKKQALLGLETSLNLLAKKLGFSLSHVRDLNSQKAYFSTGSPLYLYLLKKNRMDLTIMLDEDNLEKFKKYQKELTNKGK